MPAVDLEPLCVIGLQPDQSKVWQVLSGRHSVETSSLNADGMRGSGIMVVVARYIVLGVEDGFCFCWLV